MTTRTFTKSCVAVVFAMLAPLTLAQPSNDSCSGAIGIGVGNTGGNNTLATTGLPTLPCGTAAGIPAGKDVWYSFTAPCSGTASVGTCAPGSATFDTVIGVWNGAGGCCSISLMGCSDDFCGLQSKVQWGCFSGTTYYISVGGYNGASGSFVLNVSCTAGAPPTPLNETCSSALFIAEHQATAGSNFGASTGPDPVPPCAAGFADVWFRFSPSLSGTYIASTCHPLTNFDTVLAVWTGSPCAATNLGCNDDNCGTVSTRSDLSFVATAGTDVRISVAGYGGAQGNFMLTVYPAVEGLNFHFFHNGYQTIGFEIIGGPPSGPYFTPITLNAGLFPYGWLLGLDITLGELGSELNNPPFSGTLTSCGTTRFGPVSGIPSGVMLYGVAVASPVGMPGIIETATAKSFVVP